MQKSEQTKGQRIIKNYFSWTITFSLFFLLYPFLELSKDTLTPYISHFRLMGLSIQGMESIIQILMGLSMLGLLNIAYFLGRKISKGIVDELGA